MKTPFRSDLPLRVKWRLLSSAAFKTVLLREGKWDNHSLYGVPLSCIPSALIRQHLYLKWAQPTCRLWCRPIFSWPWFNTRWRWHLLGVNSVGKHSGFPVGRAPVLSQPQKPQREQAAFSHLNILCWGSGWPPSVGWPPTGALSGCTV